MMRALAAMLLVAACGDNVTFPQGQPLAHADTLFVVAHADDDLIFMQPQLVDALATGSVTTVYLSLGDPIKGYHQAQFQLDSARHAYSADGTWDCGYIELAGLAVQHCRLEGREVSLVAIDLTDGALMGERTNSMLHLVDGSIQYLPLVSPFGGVASTDGITQLVAEILSATTPSQIHALDLAATHGRDNSSHLFSSSFLLWGAARVGYAGPITWHRGYNVGYEPVTLDGDAYARAAEMLGYYEACAEHCGPCGTSCPASALLESHVTWLQRQYASTRIFDLAPDGHLRSGEHCLESHEDDQVTSEPCASVPEQFWVQDSDGILWNGRPPRPEGDMSYDHVRCLVETEGMLTAPTCGAHRTQSWTTPPR